MLCARLEARRLTLAFALVVMAGANAASQVPPAASRTEISTFDGWTVTCRVIEPNKRVCSAQLVITQTDEATKASRPVFSWIFGVKDGKTIGVLQVPSGVLIQPGVELQIGKDSRKLPYSQCAPNGCEAIVPMEEAFNKLAATTHTADATIVAVDGRGVKFSIVMKGFDKALAEVRK